MRLATILLNATLEMQLAFMNHFPLFALMLRAKDPWRLPGENLVFVTFCFIETFLEGGIYFNVKSFPQSLQPVLVVEVEESSLPVNSPCLMRNFILESAGPVFLHFLPVQYVVKLLPSRAVETHELPKSSSGPDYLLITILYGCCTAC